MKRLSEATKALVRQKLENGESQAQIAKELEISRGSVQNICKESCPTVEKAVGGRPSALSAQTKRALVRARTSSDKFSLKSGVKLVKNMTKLKVSRSTVRNTLLDAGLVAAPKMKRPKLMKRHIKARMEFAERHKDWTVDDWKHVIWSDETKINRFGSDGREWVWKKKGEGLKQDHVQGTVKFGGGSLMIWGCMLYDGCGYMCKIDGKMDAQLYTSILDDYVEKSAEHYSHSLGDMIFQQDNDPKHTSQRAKNWFKSKEIDVLEWPAQSPDLNPIEHLWVHLKRQLDGYPEPPKGIIELWDRVQDEWNKITPEVCRNLVESMPRRVEAVLKAKGGNTKY